MYALKKNASEQIQNASQFLSFLMEGAEAASKNQTKNNLDTFRFTQEQKEAYLKILPVYVDFVKENHTALFETYKSLANETSRMLFINLLLYRMVGPDHVQIQPDWNLDKMRSLKDKAAQYMTKQSQLAFQWDGEDLYHYENVPFKNFQYKIDTRKNCGWLFTDQYFYTSDEINIEVEPGDVVIDAGSCMGEGTIQFALCAGKHGSVYAFDPLAVHHEILAYNAAQNSLQNHIETVPFGLFDRNVCAENSGLSQTVQADFSLGKNDSVIPTVTLDSFVRERGLQKIDFIKMDIEGAELAALKGCMETIKRFKPKLAISLYHKWEDYVVIPAYLQKICPEYTFYLGHHTIHASETVLYAIKK